ERGERRKTRCASVNDWARNRITGSMRPRAWAVEPVHSASATTQVIQRRAAVTRPGSGSDLHALAEVLAQLRLHRLGDAIGIDFEPPPARRVWRTQQRFGPHVADVVVAEQQSVQLGEMAGLSQSDGTLWSDPVPAKAEHAQAAQ